MPSLVSIITAHSRLRPLLWKRVYNFMAWRTRSEIGFLNYGLWMREPLALAPEHEPHRFSIQLYHHLLMQVEVQGKQVIEIGCGQGGGCAYIARALRPQSVLGIDLSDVGIAHCRQKHPLPGLEFLPGDACQLPLEANVADIVINVESSHCYTSMSAFAAEVYRVLRPGGYLLWADIVMRKSYEEIAADFAGAGFVAVVAKDITPDVLKSIEASDEQRQSLINQHAPRGMKWMFRRFWAVPGSPLYTEFGSGATQYRSCVLQKP